MKTLSHMIKGIRLIDSELTAYNNGKAAYYNGEENPYNVDDNYTLWEAWFDGFGDEQRRDSEARIGECGT